MSESTSPQQAGPVAVYGATGYTGRLVAAELKRRGADFVIAGRSAAKLDALSEALGGARTAVASLDDPAAMQTALESCSAVISCAGSPFTENGEPVVRAAIAAGTHYIDTTGEQPFMRTVFDRDADAKAAGVALVTAMGFDYVPGDMIAALTCQGAGPFEEVRLAYWTEGFGASRGTTISAVGQIGGEDLEWRDGRLQPAPRSVRRPAFDFPEPAGRQRMVSYPAGENLTVPRHVETRNVRTTLSAATVALHPKLGATVPLMMPALRYALGTRARGLVEKAIARMPEGPSEELRRRARFVIVCEAQGAGGTRRGVIRGVDVYGLTAVTTVEGALRCATPGYEESGALAPSEAFDPRDFLAAIAHFGVSYELGQQA
jgi:short subunit dehydrogenase-like uncharacterized protein